MESMIDANISGSVASDEKSEKSASRFLLFPAKNIPSAEPDTAAVPPTARTMRNTKMYNRSREANMTTKIIAMGPYLYDVRKIFGFFDPSPPCHIQKSADLVPLVCFLWILSPPSADII